MLGTARAHDAPHQAGRRREVGRECRRAGLRRPDAAMIPRGGRSRHAGAPVAEASSVTAVRKISARSSDALTDPTIRFTRTTSSRRRSLCASRIVCSAPPRSPDRRRPRRARNWSAGKSRGRSCRSASTPSTSPFDRSGMKAPAFNPSMAAAARSRPIRRSLPKSGTTRWFRPGPMKPPIPARNCWRIACANSSDRPVENASARFPCASQVSRAQRVIPKTSCVVSAMTRKISRRSCVATRRREMLDHRFHLAAAAPPSTRAVARSRSRLRPGWQSLQPWRSRSRQTVWPRSARP